MDPLWHHCDKTFVAPFWVTLALDLLKGFGKFYKNHIIIFGIFILRTDNIFENFRKSLLNKCEDVWEVCNALDSKMSH